MLLLAPHLGERPATDAEDRVVAEAVIAARLGGDLAFDDPLDGDLLARRIDESNGCLEAGGSPSDPIHFGEELGDVVRV